MYSNYPNMGMSTNGGVRAANPIQQNWGGVVQGGGTAPQREQPQQAPASQNGTMSPWMNQGGMLGRLGGMANQGNMGNQGNGGVVPPWMSQGQNQNQQQNPGQMGSPMRQGWQWGQNGPGNQGPMPPQWGNQGQGPGSYGSPYGQYQGGGFSQMNRTPWENAQQTPSHSMGGIPGNTGPMPPSPNPYQPSSTPDASAGGSIGGVDTGGWGGPISPPSPMGNKPSGGVVSPGPNGGSPGTNPNWSNGWRRMS